MSTQADQLPIAGKQVKVALEAAIQEGKAMGRIVTIESDFGPIHIEVDDETARQGGSSIEGTTSDNGVTPVSSDESQEILKSNTRFEKAMASLGSYTASVQQVVEGLDVRPNEVTIEVGLKFAFEAGAGFFAIAKAGTEADMRVTLMWQPKQAVAK